MYDIYIIILYKYVAYSKLSRLRTRYRCLLVDMLLTTHLSNAIRRISCYLAALNVATGGRLHYGVASEVGPHEAIRAGQERESGLASGYHSTCAGSERRRVTCRSVGIWTRSLTYTCICTVLYNVTSVQLYTKVLIIHITIQYTYYIDVM